MVLAKDVLQSPSAQSDIEQKQVAACVGLIDATWEKARALLTSNKTPRSNSVSSEEIEKMFSQFKELTKQQPGVSDSSALSTTSGKVLARILRQQEMKTCVVLTAMLRQEMAQQTESSNEDVFQSLASNGRFVTLPIGQKQADLTDEVVASTTTDKDTGKQTDEVNDQAVEFKISTELGKLSDEVTIQVVAGTTTDKDAGKQTDEVNDRAMAFKEISTELGKLSDEVTIQQSKALCCALCEDISTSDAIDAAKIVTEKRSVKCIDRRLGRQEIRASTILCDMLHGAVNRQRADKGEKTVGGNQKAIAFQNAFDRLQELARQHVTVTSVYETFD
jgi:hypothetical protein